MIAVLGFTQKAKVAVMWVTRNGEKERDWPCFSPAELLVLGNSSTE